MLGSPAKWGGLLEDAPFTGVLCGQGSVGVGGDGAACTGGVAPLQPRHSGPWPPLVCMAGDFLSPDRSQCSLG